MFARQIHNFVTAANLFMLQKQTWEFQTNRKTLQNEASLRTTQQSNWKSMGWRRKVAAAEFVRVCKRKIKTFHKNQLELHWLIVKVFNRLAEMNYDALMLKPRWWMELVKRICIDTMRPLEPCSLNCHAFHSPADWIDNEIFTFAAVMPHAPIPLHCLHKKWIINFVYYWWKLNTQCSPNFPTESSIPA